MNTQVFNSNELSRNDPSSTSDTSPLAAEVQWGIRLSNHNETLLVENAAVDAEQPATLLSQVQRGLRLSNHNQTFIQDGA